MLQGLSILSGWGLGWVEFELLDGEGELFGCLLLFSAFSYVLRTDWMDMSPRLPKTTNKLISCVPQDSHNFQSLPTYPGLKPAS